MGRALILVLALSGCDVVLQIQHVDTQPGACGPYSTVMPVPITGVEEPRGFSISRDETMALVTGKDASNQTRPIVLHFNGTTWEPDPNPKLQAGLMSGMKGAVLADSEPLPSGSGYPGDTLMPAMLLSTLPASGSKLQVGRYYWSGTTWAQDNNQPAFALSGYDVYPGNVWVRVGATNTDVDRVRHTVLWMVTQDVSEGPNKIAITANSPPSWTLEDKARTVGINSVGRRFGQAVMTEDRTKLVYAALSGDRNDIFAVDQDPDSRTFDGAGGSIPRVDSSDDEVEPWINDDCSKLYFRRIPSDTPSGAGQIYVAQ